MKMHTLLAGLCAATLGSAAANATTIDFSTFADNTFVSSVGSASFALYGNGQSGPPLASYAFQFYSPVELGNTSYGEYPTSNGIEIQFVGGADNVSFTFDNYGENDTSFEEAYSGATQTDYQNIGGPDCASGFCTVSVVGSDITTLYVDNGENSSGSWEYGIGEITYTSVPEPASLTLLGTAVIGLGAAPRRRRRKALAA